MSFILQNSLSNSIHYRIRFHFPNSTQLNPSKIPKLPLFQNPNQSIQFNNYPFHKTLILSHFHPLPINSYNSSLNFPDELEKPSSKSSSFDVFLSVIESFCVVSSMVISVGYAVNWVLYKRYNYGVLMVLGKEVLVWLLMGAVVIGSVIRRRQWRRVCGDKPRLKPGFESGNLIERIEKLEESMRSVGGIIRMLSRQLEKLGVRFRVTRKAIKDPISEIAALAQKNSDATRALSMKEDLLETELVEIQKMLLAMQEQQQKQLELILAIAKSGKLLENKRAPNQAPGMSKKDSNHRPTSVDGPAIQTRTGQKDTTNNKVLG